MRYANILDTAGYFRTVIIFAFDRTMRINGATAILEKNASPCEVPVKIIDSRQRQSCRFVEFIHPQRREDFHPAVINVNAVDDKISACEFIGIHRKVFRRFFHFTRCEPSGVFVAAIAALKAFTIHRYHLAFLSEKVNDESGLQEHEKVI
jgi:hypothetical protein